MSGLTTLLKRFHRNEGGQAMTEAAIVLPIIVLFTLAAHEFLWFNHNYHRVIWATRYITWEVSEATNHPDHSDSNNEGETSHGTRDTALNAAVTEAYDLFFRLPGPGADKPGHQRGYHTYWRPVTDNNTPGIDGGTYGYRRSFPFSDLTFGNNGQSDPTGGTISDIVSFLFAGGTLSDFGLPSGVTDIIGNSFTIGPDLPVRGYYDCGYVAGWTPAFFKILLPGQGRSRGDKGFWSAGGQPEQWEGISVDRGGARVLWLGWNSPKDGKAPWYAKLAIITHNWMAQDAQQDMWYHTKGFTLVGSFGSASDTASGLNVSLILDAILSDVLPFRCVVYPNYVGQPSEGAPMGSTKG